MQCSTSRPVDQPTSQPRPLRPLTTYLYLPTTRQPAISQPSSHQPSYLTMRRTASVSLIRASSSSGSAIAGSRAAAALAPDDTDPPSRPLTVVTESTTLAFACYDELTNQILVEECRAHGGSDTEMAVRGFVECVRPNLVLVGGRVAGNSGLLRLLTRGVVDSDDNDDSNGGNGGNGARPTSNGTAAGSSNNNNKNAAAAPPRSANGGEDEAPPIPYRLLKSAAFDLRNCRSIILTKLRVLALLRQQGQREQQQQQQQQQGQQHGMGMGMGMGAMEMGGMGMDGAAAVGDPNHHGRYFPNSATNYHPHRNPSTYHSISSIVDLNSPCLVKALGALLHHLQSTTFRLEDGGTVTVNTVRHAHSSQYMRIDSSTLSSLHIFATDHHPLIAKGRGRDKEGFSLFTLLDRTKSKMGRGRLREIMVQPLLDPALIAMRHDGIDLFLKSECQSAVGTILTLLGQVGAVDKILLRMQRCHAVAADFLILSQTLGCAVGICTTLATEVRNVLVGELEESGGGQLGQQNGGGGGLVDDATAAEAAARNAAASGQLAFLNDILRRCHVPVLRDLHDRLTSIVDHEMTAETKDCVVVHYGFHEELDAAKEAFDNLDETLSTVGAQVLSKHPELRQLKVVFLPQVGFLLTLDKRNHAHNVATNEFPDLPSDFQFVFLQNNDAYFKNAEMIQLDEEIGDLDAYIKDQEAMIVHELEDDILDGEMELRSTFGAIADLDCILSFTGCASDLNFVRPEIVASDPGSDESSIYVENGRHPLQELVIDNEYIANDTMIDSTNRVNVVTGPNFSGKSCYARQVGVLVYLAHIGCFVPCDRAKIAITDQILARISNVETCAVPQSSFQQDLTQMATILRRSTPRTLVLIDEFGKGTAPSSGIAVLTSALRKLSSIKCKVVCTTHFLEIFSLGLLKDGQGGIKTLRMAVHVPSSDEDNPVPLFKLEEGVANSSAGLVCARMAGVKRSVVGRANEILGALKDGNPVQPISAVKNNNSVLQPAAKSALRHFLGMDSWANASMDDVETLQEKIMCM